MSQISAASASGPAFSAFENTGTQSIPNSVTTKVSWTAEDFDTDGQFTADRFTPLKAGKYLVSCTITPTQEVSGASYILYIYKNGAAHKQFQKVGAITSTGDISLTMTTIVDMNGTTDYLEAFFFQNSGAALTLRANARNTFTAAWLRS